MKLAYYSIIFALSFCPGCTQQQYNNNPYQNGSRKNCGCATIEIRKARSSVRTKDTNQTEIEKELSRLRAILNDKILETK